MKTPLYAAALLLGGLIGYVALQASKPPTEGGSKQQSSTSQTSLKSMQRSGTTNTQIQRLISNESPAMSENLPLDEATKILFAEEKSPMRARSFLKHRIHLMTLEQLNTALTNGEIQSDAEIREAARKLATEDPEGTFQAMMIDHSYRLRGMDNFYTFSNTMLEVGVKTDALAMMKRLQTMPRGGSQQDSSLRFSSKWAANNPAAAAEHFDDLVYLRNLSGKGEAVFTDNKYANSIVKSWQKKDAEALRDYVQNLPAGKKQQTFQSSLEKITKSTEASH